jgi:hypothetical protein
MRATTAVALAMFVVGAQFTRPISPAKSQSTTSVVPHDMTVKKLLTACSSAHNTPDYPVCLLFMAGFDAGAAATLAPTPWCRPQNLTVEDEILKLVRVLRTRSQLLDEPVWTAVGAAMATAYPCQSKAGSQTSAKIGPKGYPSSPIPSQIAAAEQPLLKERDLPKIVETYRENETRFGKDFLGKRFSDVLPFRSAVEMLFRGTYRVGFGTGILASDLDCTVTSPDDISRIGEWRKGDKIYVEGIVKDVIRGSVELEQCTLSN